MKLFLAIFLISLNGCSWVYEKNTPLTNPSISGAPSVSSDGSFVFIAEAGIKIDLPSQSELLTVSNTDQAYTPKFSPSHNHVFFLQLSKRKYYSELWMHNLKTGEHVKLSDESHGDVSSYSISNDGLSVAFTAFHDNRNKEAVFIVDLGGGAVVREVKGLPVSLRGGELVFIKDTDALLLLMESRLFIVDVQTAAYTETIPWAENIHTLGRNGYFSSYFDGYYQIFKFEIKDRSIVQVTFDPTNKLRPKLSSGNKLYYIDAGDEIDFKKLYLYQWLYLLNSTYGYKDYSNDWGRQAWAESSILEFLNNVVAITKDKYFIGVLADHVWAVIQASDNNSGLVDYFGVSDCGWSATRYSIEKSERIRHIVHDAMIGAQLARYANLLKSNPDLASSYGRSLRDLKSFLRCLEDSNSKDWRTVKNDELNIIEGDEGYFIIPKGSPERFDGINVPFNFQNKYGYFLLKLWLLTENDSYLEAANSMATIFLRHMRESENGYSWPYWWGVGYEGWSEYSGFSNNTISSPGTKTLASSSYAGIDVEFITELLKSAKYDSNEIRKKLINTFMSESIMSFDDVGVGTMLSKYSLEARNKALAEPKIYDIQLRYMPLLGSLSDAKPSNWTLNVKDLNQSLDKRAQTIEVSNEFVSYDLLYGDDILIINKKDQGYFYQIEERDSK